MAGESATLSRQVKPLDSEGGVQGKMDTGGGGGRWGGGGGVLGSCKNQGNGCIPYIDDGSLLGRLEAGKGGGEALHLVLLSC
jgi:hypothetical protein